MPGDPADTRGKADVDKTYAEFDNYVAGRNQTNPNPPPWNAGPEAADYPEPK